MCHTETLDLLHVVVHSSTEKEYTAYFTGTKPVLVASTSRHEPLRGFKLPRLLLECSMQTNAIHFAGNGN